MDKKLRLYLMGILILSMCLSLACRLPGMIGDIKSMVDTAEELQKTAVNLASQIPPGFEKTAEAAVTQIMGEEGFQETLDASLDQLDDLGEKNPPPDIPLLDNRKEEYSLTPDLVSYSVDVPYQDALEFYKQGMLANGWTFIETGSAEADGAAALNYEKDNRKAVVALSWIDNLTVVMVSIYTK